MSILSLGIEISASLLAVREEVTKRAAGAASERLIEASAHQVSRFRGIISDKDEARYAALIVDSVVAEAAQFPPQAAVIVHPLANVGATGIFDGEKLKLETLWINRADFPILVRDVEFDVNVDGGLWIGAQGDEFALPPRGELTRNLVARPRGDVAPFERGGATCEISLRALLSGPWSDGQAQKTRYLSTVAVWLPAFGANRGLLSDAADIELALEHHIAMLLVTGQTTVKVVYDDLDKQLKLRAGAAREFLGSVAQRKGHEYRGAPNVGLLTLKRPMPRAYGGWVSRRSRDGF